MPLEGGRACRGGGARRKGTREKRTAKVEKRETNVECESAGQSARGRVSSRVDVNDESVGGGRWRPAGCG